MSRIHGDTSNLKASQAKALERLGDRSVAADRVANAALARDVLDLSHELNRRVGLFLDRRGRVTHVILGDAHSLQLPEFERVRGAAGRLRGIRLLTTHLVPEGLDREELADLAKLRLDLVAAIHRGPAGISVDMANLTPSRAGHETFHIHTWPRVPLSVLLREEDTPSEPEFAGVPIAIDEFLTRLESELVEATTRARAASQGIRAMALMVHDGEPDVEARVHELHELCRTAGVQLVDIVKQRRPHPDPRSFFGTGKLREVIVQALEQDVEVLICDPELTASQARTIGEASDIKVIDRTMLILDIFAQHAKSSDGKLQVELAQLRYRLPKMMGKGTMMSRLAGGIGGRGPGETKLEIDRRRARDRITELEHRLQQLRRHRNQQRAQRHRTDVPVAAIVGYTNAGKSTLLNALTQSDVLAEDRLFATLDPTVRRIRFPRDREIVLLDTVGFIRELPPALRQAFSATLEEVAEADLLLHVVDISDPDHGQQIDTVRAILGELGAGSIPTLVVFNKCDRLPPELAESHRRNARADEFYVSAMDRKTTRPLVAAIEEHFWSTGKFERDGFTSSTDAILMDAAPADATEPTADVTARAQR